MKITVNWNGESKTETKLIKMLEIMISTYKQLTQLSCEEEETEEFNQLFDKTFALDKENNQLVIDADFDELGITEEDVAEILSSFKPKVGE